MNIIKEIGALEKNRFAALIDYIYLTGWVDCNSESCIGDESDEDRQERLFYMIAKWLGLDLFEEEGDPGA